MPNNSQLLSLTVGCVCEKEGQGQGQREREREVAEQIYDVSAPGKMFSFSFLFFGPYPACQQLVQFHATFPKHIASGRQTHTPTPTHTHTPSHTRTREAAIAINFVFIFGGHNFIEGDPSRPSLENIIRTDIGI